MSDDDYPEYSEDAELGDRGRRLVEDIVRDGLRWIFREIPKDDLGIDGYVEILREDRKSQGRLFAVQIKTGPSYLAEPNDDGFVYRGALKHLDELDDNDQFIDMYDRDLPQMRGREKASLPQGESPSATTG